MKQFLVLLAASTALTGAPAAAQMNHSSMAMPGMTMPAPTVKKPVAKKASAKKAVSKATPAKKMPVKTATHAQHSPLPAPPAMDPAMPMVQSKMDPAIPMPATEPMPAEHSGHDTGAMPAAPATDAAMTGHDMAGMPGMAHGGHAGMLGAFGAYPSTREASGTSWQPDTSEHAGVMRSAGDWMLMVHGNVDLIADTQSGRRGDDKVFVAGMLMGMATRTAANGNTLQFRAMVSPDPLMGKKGYPLLLASGETANGIDRLVDRQHPHDLFMELSASYSVKLADKASAFVYAGLPGEPAFGPPAFMHRQSISTSPEAPISHHWLDSTHITFGVVTVGAVLDRIKLEASRFNAREPDQHRYNIETGPLDSSSLRVSWNPTDTLSLQGSWAHLKSPEQLEPGVNQRRWSASGSYTRPMKRGWWATTLAWGRKTIDGESQDAFALESSVKRDDWTLFGRGEYTENNELVDTDGGHGRAYKVGKVSLGLVRDFPVAAHLKFGVGGLYSLNFIPNGLRDEYGGSNPHGAMGFVRLKIQ